MSSRNAALLSLVVGALVSMGAYHHHFEASSPLLDTLPLSEDTYVLGNEVKEYADFMMSGGPPPDGIPSIDEPSFVNAGEADLASGDIVIGFHHGGEARAYPQNILVHHEIVNDAVGGLNVAITYCPLTATAQGFKRGTTTLGVSGQLLNSNLVMFDRDTESYFSQIAATGVTGEYTGRSLDEVNLIWTTWERWRSEYPNTKVLSEDTGHLRNYSNDPYGSYNPVGGYYQQDQVMFPLMNESGEYHSKEMVVGARTSAHSGFFVMSDLKEERVQSTSSFLAVYDPDLATGRIYPRPSAEVSPQENGAYKMNGETYEADELPMEELVSVEAFYFAWNAFYPDSEHV